MATTAKLRVYAVDKSADGKSVRLRMSAVGDTEEKYKEWALNTPACTVDITVKSEIAEAQFGVSQDHDGQINLGKLFTVTFEMDEESE